MFIFNYRFVAPVFRSILAGIIEAYDYGWMDNEWILAEIEKIPGTYYAIQGIWGEYLTIDEAINLLREHC